MGLLVRLDRLEHCGEVLGRVHLCVLVDDLTLLVDDEGPARGGVLADEGQGLAFYGALDFAARAGGHTEGFGEFSLGVREQGEVELFRILEMLKRLDVVAADTDYHRVELGEFLCAIAVGAGLLGAAGRHGSGVEVDDDVLLLKEVAAGPVFALIGLGGEAGRFVPDFEGVGEWREQAGCEQESGELFHRAWTGVFNEGDVAVFVAA